MPETQHINRRAETDQNHYSTGMSDSINMHGNIKENHFFQERHTAR